jgi:hypothetical protein
MRIVYVILIVLGIAGCSSQGSTKKKPWTNNGIAVVMNGMDKPDSLKYECDSCVAFFVDKKILDTIIAMSTKDARESLKNELSFRPISLKIEVFKRDSAYYYDGTKVDSLLIVITDYKCIGKNAYGVEGDVNSPGIYYLIGGRPVDISSRLRKSPLAIVDAGGGTRVVSRTLDIYDDDGSFKIQPSNSSGQINIILTSSQSCVEDASLYITFEGEKKLRLESWNDFNCKGNNYFRLKESDISILAKKPIFYISFIEGESVSGIVPQNERDYFMQYFSLLAKNQ